MNEWEIFQTTFLETKNFMNSPGEVGVDSVAEVAVEVLFVDVYFEELAERQVDKSGKFAAFETRICKRIRKI